MATFSSDRIPDASIDANAVSIVISDRGDDGRRGSFFNNDFSAVVPVYFQNLDGNKFLGVFSQRWYNAVLPEEATDPNLFASFTVDTMPSWSIFDGANGHHYQIQTQYGFNPPTRIAHDNRTLVSACSRTNTYLFVLQRFTLSGATFGVISHYHINPISWEVNLLAEEQIPSITVNGDIVTFDRGMRYGITYLIFVGGDTNGNLYLARRNWGYIGRTPKIEYQTDRGWTEDMTQAVPLKRPDGSNLTSAGPVDLMEYKNKTWMSVVENSGGTMTAQVYSSAGLYDPWTPENHPYALGVLGSTYMGGTVYFQPSLRAHPTSVSETATSGIPVVYSTKVVSGDEQGVSIHWDLWPLTVSGISRNLAVQSQLEIQATDTPTAITS